MLAVKSMNVRNNFKEWCNQVINGETLIVSRPKNENVVILSEKEYNELQKAKRNTEYLAMLDESQAQLERGETISFTMEELRAMEADDWKPSKKVLEFEHKHGIKRYEGTGKPEPLKHRSGYSRRIDDANRLVYDIDELQNICIIACKGHYED